MSVSEGALGSVELRVDPAAAGDVLGGVADPRVLCVSQKHTVRSVGESSSVPNLSWVHTLSSFARSPMRLIEGRESYSYL